MRTNTCYRVGFPLLIALTTSVVATGCSATQDRAAETTHATGVVSSVLGGIAKMPDASRVTTYDSLAGLLTDTSQVVVAHANSVALQLDDVYGEKEAPLGLLQMQVDQVISGSTQGGGTITIAVEAGYNDAGQLYSNKISQKATYLLFLSPIGNREPDVLAVTGYLAGLYLDAGSGNFTKLDPENPRLPDNLSVDQVEQALKAR